MDLYLNSVGIISGAGNNMSDDFLVQAPDYTTTFLPAVEPDYKEYIPVMQLRRMSRAVRMGVVAAKKAMADAGIEKPDAFSIGTAYGCLQDTEKFLEKMIEQEEQMLTPTAFIQSTHNTVGGQVALLAGCNGHNMTYVHRGHSFEHALINTQLYLNEHNGETMLAGGIDEQTPNSIKALQAGGIFTKDELTVKHVLAGNNKAAVGTEGAAFFTVTQAPQSDKYIRVKDLLVFKAYGDDVLNKITAFAEKNIDTTVDVFLSGANGTEEYSAVYKNIKTKLYPDAALAQFKHCTGDYPVASSVALGMLLSGVQKGSLPAHIFVDKQPEQVKHIVMVNNFGSYFSCWLLELSV